MFAFKVLPDCTEKSELSPVIHYKRYMRSTPICNSLIGVWRDDATMHLQGFRNNSGSGLVNGGNECHFNAALQSLCRCKPLIDGLQSIYNGPHSPSSPSSNTFGFKLLRLSNRLQSGQGPQHAGDIIASICKAHAVT